MFVVTVAFLFCTGLVIAVIFYSHSPEAAIPRKVVAKQPKPTSPIKKYSRKVTNIWTLISLSPKQIDGIDIAEMNLLCAEGLPGAYYLDIDYCLAKLDEWAERVRLETERHLYRVADPHFAEHYHHSESYYRAEMLLQVLQEDCGVKYNPERIRNVDFTNSKDLFIHGMINDDNGGTCASMPVLYIAVGRRLGYPLYLVPTKGHLFVRWDDGNNRFNIEGSGNGFSSYSDEYYHKWPLPLTDADKQSGQFLTSLTPTQELAAFLATRGHCLYDLKKYDNATYIYSSASKFNPSNLLYQKWFQLASRAMNTSENNLQNRPPL
jgi:hypothetical protein